jgi:hypothetical protein
MLDLFDNFRGLNFRQSLYSITVTLKCHHVFNVCLAYLRMDEALGKRGSRIPLWLDCDPGQCLFLSASGVSVDLDQDTM